MKETCCECQRKRDRCIPVVKHVDGRVDVVCPQCWKKLEYYDFFK